MCAQGHTANNAGAGIQIWEAWLQGLGHSHKYPARTGMVAPILQMRKLKPKKITHWSGQLVTWLSGTSSSLASIDLFLPCER